MITGHSVRQIPIIRIRVLNPRPRSQTSHDEIVKSIAEVGLKRPITVSARSDLEGDFDLVCGQGRLEAYRKLGQVTIPAVVLDLSEEDCLVRGLVENVARRQHTGAELVSDVLALRQRGYSDDEIAGKIGLSPSWVGKIAMLLEHGEAGLLQAVESGFLPVSLAVVIACEPSSEVQSVLAGAYASGLVTAANLPRIRRLLERRTREGAVKRSAGPRIEPHEVLRALEREAARHRLMVKRTDLLQLRLAFVVQALRDLRGDDTFVELCRAEQLDLPKALADRVSGVGHV
jgi:ParB family chromosome partitioning protein